MTETLAVSDSPLAIPAIWYFDFVSPFACLHLKRFGEFQGRLQITARPVLLAGLLDAWHNTGPAEIPPKRRYIYRQCQWRAARMGLLSWSLPAAHPFNPLPYLRLAIGLDCRLEVIGTIFDFLYRATCHPADPAMWRALSEQLGANDADQLIQQGWVKEQLRRNTEQAIADGAFGVPTLLVAGELFWGADSVEMMLDFLHDRELFQQPAMRRLDTLPIAAARRTRKTA